MDHRPAFVAAMFWVAIMSIKSHVFGSSAKRVTGYTFMGSAEPCVFYAVSILASGSVV